MLTREQAIERQRNLIKSSMECRAYYDAYWSLALIYAYGPQWGHISPENGALNVKFLKHVTDPNREDIRVAMNRILPDIRKMGSALKPARIAASLRPRSGMPNMAVIRDTAEKLQSKHLHAAGALEALREKEEARLVYGSVIVRRTLRQRGKIIPVGTEQSIRTVEESWAVCMPWEFLRDPSARTLRPDRDEEIICQEKPRTVQWVKRNFGVEIETESTMGALLNYQQKLQLTQGMGRFVSDSKMKGVIVRETYFQDPDVEAAWPYALITWQDPKQGDGNPEVLHFGRNPFYGCPFELFAFDEREGAPWGRGVPHLQMAGQDVTNLAYSWLLRLIISGTGKWIVEKNTVEQPSRTLNNRVDEPIIWDRQGRQYAQKPERSAPPQPGSALMEVLKLAPEWMRDALNFSGVQFGEAVKRGEAAEAYKIRLQEASSVLETRRRDDELRIQRLLYATLCDVVRHYRLDQMREILRGEAPDEAIRMLKRQPIPDVIERVDLKPVTLRPITPMEVQEKFVSLTQSQIMTADDAQWEMMLAGQSVNTSMAEAHSQQLMEIDQIITGADVSPSIMDRDTFHIRTLEDFGNSVKWFGLDPETQNRILAHYALHYARMQQKLMQQGGMAPAQSATPPAEAVEAAASMPEGSVNPSIEAA